MDKSMASGATALPRSRRGVTTVRFVGGPWHNRLVEVAPRARIGVEYFDAEYRGGQARRVAKYLLCYFETGFGTRFCEYVYDELFTSDGDLQPGVIDERQIVRLPSYRG